MKKTLRTKIIAPLLVLALVIGSVFTILISSGVAVYNVSAATFGLRFKQVALGEDFAIALSYDGDLYGWDLKAIGKEEFNKLGTHYGTEPKKIDVTFTSGYSVKDDAITKNPDAPTSDKILKIAATRESAAFITENNYIYTWGKNTFSSSSPSNLGVLLKNGDSVTVPTMVDYIGGSSNDIYKDLKLMVPGYSRASSTTVAGMAIGKSAHDKGQLLDIVGGDNNYVVKHLRGEVKNADGVVTQRGYVAFFTWGDAKYYTAGQKYTGSADEMAVYMCEYGYQRAELLGDEHDNVSIGGGTLVIAHGDNLFVKGRNYYVPAVSDASYVYSVGQYVAHSSNDVLNAVYLDNIFNLYTNDSEQDRGYNATPSSVPITSNPFTFDAGIIPRIKVGEGANTPTVYSVNEGIAYRGEKKNDDYKEFYPVAGSVASSGEDPMYAGGMYTSTAAYNLQTISGNSDVKIDRTSLSMGTGYGYIVAKDGKVYFFGNGYNGQRGDASDSADRKGYPNLTEMPTPSGLTGAPVVSVAAGKAQLGTPIYSDFSTNNPARVYRGVINSDNKLQLGGFSGADTGDTKMLFNAHKDGDVFMSGAIFQTNNGGRNVVYVWNKDKSFTDITDKFPGVDGSKTRIVKLFAGYNNNMVAISSHGKIYQIKYVKPSDTEPEEFSVELKDTFTYDDASSTEITIPNYAVRENNAIDFAVSNGRPSKAGESQSNARFATFDLNRVTAADGVVFDKTAFGSVLSEDNSMDAYRILTAQDDNLSSKMIFSSRDLIGTNKEKIPSSGEPKFYFEGEAAEIDPEILGHYLAYEFVEDSTSGDVSVKITPYQSTKDKTIVMYYYFARCGSNADKKDSLDRTSASSAYKFYDCAKASVKIRIANTEASFNKFSYNLSSSDTSNLSIPVLDPNNKKNNVYSVALTNVLYGLDELGKYAGLSGDPLTKYHEAITALAYIADDGFPARKRVVDADLARFYDESGADVNFKHSTYYNDRYQYFAFDPDGDELSFNADGFVPFQNAKNHYSAADRVITLSLPLTGTGYDLSAFTAEKLAKFNNIYGLSLEIKDSALEISYRVVQFTALKSTAFDYKRISEDEGETGVDIRKPSTHYSTENASPYYLVNLSEKYYDISEGAAKEAIRSNAESEDPSSLIYVPVCVRASLTTNMNFDGTPYRATPGYDEYKITPRAITVAADDNERVFTFRLADSGLFNDYNNIFLTFKSSKEGAVGYQAYGEFIKEFDRNIVNVSLNKSVFTFEAKAPGSYKDIKIEVRRFADASLAAPFFSGTKTADAEVITLIFDITVGKSLFQQTVESKEGLLSGLNARTVTTKTSIPVGDFTDNAKDAYLSSCSSSNDAVAIVAASEDRKTLIITPVSSGSIMVSVSATQYMFTGKGTFVVNVESRSVLPEEKAISLRGTTTVYLAEFKAAIAKTFTGEETFDFNAYVIDRTGTDHPEGYYFIRGTKVEGSTDLKWEPISKPDFVGDIKVETDKASATAEENAITFTLGAYKSTDDFDNIRFVVKFRSNDDKKHFEAAVTIKPAKRAMLGEDGGELTLDINVARKKVQETAAKIGEVTPDADGLKISIDKVTASSKMPAGVYTLQFVRPQQNAAYKYFDLRHKEGETDFTIIPKANTLDENGNASKYQINIVVVDSVGKSTVVTLNIGINGIKDRLDRDTYIMLWLAVAASVFFFLLVVFIVRMGLYWKRKGEQRRIIRKNQMLIKMRDKVHNKGEAGISKEQIVQTKLKLEDPKYAKMFNEMKRASEERGVSIDEDIEKKAKKSKKDKKKGKKSLKDLQEELAARKEALSKMQMGETPMGEVPAEGVFDAGGTPFGEGMNDMFSSNMGGGMNADENILFDVETMGDNN